MRTSRLLFALTVLAALVVVGGMSFAASREPSPATSPSMSIDWSGPCDEAEHAQDPRCTGENTPPVTSADDGAGPAARTGSAKTSEPSEEATASATPSTRATSSDDISGPCDEAEHVNDPRCTGATSWSDDRSGSGDHDHGRHGGRDDRLDDHGGRDDRLDGHSDRDDDDDDDGRRGRGRGRGGEDGGDDD